MPTNKSHKHTKLRSTDAHHHQHIRLKRQATKKSKATIVDRLVYIAGPMIPVAILPTAYAVWFADGADGIALPTWIILSCTSFVMSIYAVVHKEKPLVLTYIPLFFLNISVVVGSLIR